MLLNIQPKSGVQTHMEYDPTETGLELLFHKSLNSNQICSEVYSSVRGLRHETHIWIWNWYNKKTKILCVPNTCLFGV